MTAAFCLVEHLLAKNPIGIVVGRTCNSKFSFVLELTPVDQKSPLHWIQEQNEWKLGLSEDIIATIVNLQFESLLRLKSSTEKMISQNENLEGI